MNKNVDNSKKIPELCVPAGNFNILKYAINYGADSVYIGSNRFNLRSFGDNFKTDEITEAVDYVHKRNKKIYLTLNAIIDEKETSELKGYLKEIKNINLDAVIISDPAVFILVRDVIPDIRIHISTQVSTSNHLAVNFWAGLGAKRVNIAREVPYNEIIDIVKKTDIEIEVFVHGALCISYSGRCMLSKYLSGRDANKGKCSHTCRWKYYLMEEKRTNMFFPVIQGNRGTYIYNSRDLCLLDMLDLIVDAGVGALKIEGRMKTENYVALTSRVYRQALDLIKEGKFNGKKKKYLLAELDKTNHRNFTTGFMFLGNAESNPELVENDNVGYIRKYKFIGVVEGYDKENNGPVIRAKNQFKMQDIIDISEPGNESRIINLDSILDYKTKESKRIVNTNDLVILPGLGNIDKFSILRLKR